MDKILFYHGTTNDLNFRRFTIAGRFEEQNRELSLAISICSNQDQFVRKIGRKKAEGRLFSKGFKGNILINLYSNNYFKSKSKKGFKENWFVGKEIKLFTKLCNKLEKLTFKELLVKFQLNEH